MAFFAVMDEVRRAQGDAFEAIGAAPRESRYHVAGQSPLWRLRDYGERRWGSAVLIVSAPIKRPYIWDLTPATSVIRYLRRAGFRVFLLEWLKPAPQERGHGLADYGGRFIGEAIARLKAETGRSQPILMGHSLGGTFAATFAASNPSVPGGLVLLGAPLCFARGTSSFRDALTAMVPAEQRYAEIVPGSFLSLISALAAPQTFIWSRMLHAAATAPDPRAGKLQALIERWCLDEFPMPGRLARDIYIDLYCEDRFCKGTLDLGAGAVGACDLETPLLAVVTDGDDIAPRAAMDRFLDLGEHIRAQIIQCPTELGTGFAHLGILIGHATRTKVWPRIVDWMRQV